MKFERLRQSDRLEESGLSGDGHVRPVRAFLGLYSEGLGYRLDRSDEAKQLAGYATSKQANDFWSFPEINTFKFQIQRRTVYFVRGCP